MNHLEAALTVSAREFSWLELRLARLRGLAAVSPHERITLEGHLDAVERAVASFAQARAQLEAGTRPLGELESEKARRALGYFARSSMRASVRRAVVLLVVEFRAFASTLRRVANEHLLTATTLDELTSALATETLIYARASAHQRAVVTSRRLVLFDADGNRHEHALENLEVLGALNSTEFRDVWVVEVVMNGELRDRITLRWIPEGLWAALRHMKVRVSPWPMPALVLR